MPPTTKPTCSNFQQQEQNNPKPPQHTIPYQNRAIKTEPPHHNTPE
jgi:hypothetical protein